MLLLFFTLVWLSIWSFVNAMIWRAKHDENFITSRSICTSCNKILLAIDLIPIFSYLNLRWKCRFCKEDIWLKYIVVEILYWILFFTAALSFFHYWIFNWDQVDFSIFLFVSSVLLWISIYDIIYLEIFDPLIILSTFVILFLDFLWIWFTQIPSAFKWAMLIYIFFYLQILLPVWYHAIKNRKLNLITESLMSFILFPFWMSLRLFFREKTLDKVPLFKQEDSSDSITTWIWGWDLRMAFFIWFLLWFEKSLAVLFVSYFVWAIFWIWLLIKWMLDWKRYREVPFIPFLSLATVVILIYWDQLIDWYKSLIYII